MEYFNGYLRGPFAAFCARKGWEQRRDRAQDAAAFAAIPHHPSYVAPGDRQHHMRQVQVRFFALRGSCLYTRTDLGSAVGLGFWICSIIYQHHLCAQALTGQLLQGQLELQAQVQNYITSQISIQTELLTVRVAPFCGLGSKDKAFLLRPRPLTFLNQPKTNTNRTWSNRASGHSSPRPSSPPAPTTASSSSSSSSSSPCR